MANITLFFLRFIHGKVETSFDGHETTKKIFERVSLLDIVNRMRYIQCIVTSNHRLKIVLLTRTKCNLILH